MKITTDPSAPSAPRASMLPHAEAQLRAATVASQPSPTDETRSWTLLDVAERNVQSRRVRREVLNFAIVCAALFAFWSATAFFEQLGEVAS